MNDNKASEIEQRLAALEGKRMGSDAVLGVTLVLATGGVLLGVFALMKPSIRVTIMEGPLPLPLPVPLPGVV